MPHEVISCNAEIDIPRDVAVCPYCKGSLRASFDGWDEADDGSWVASSTNLTCSNEPCPEDDESEEAFRQHVNEHSYMPYVYWLPVDNLVTKWINSKYRFEN